MARLANWLVTLALFVVVLALFVVFVCVKRVNVFRGRRCQSSMK